MLKYFAPLDKTVGVMQRKTVKISCCIHMRQTAYHVTKIPDTEFQGILIFPSQNDF